MLAALSGGPVWAQNARVAVETPAGMTGVPALPQSRLGASGFSNAALILSLSPSALTPLPASVAAPVMPLAASPISADEPAFAASEVEPSAAAPPSAAQDATAAESAAPAGSSRHPLELAARDETQAESVFDGSLRAGTKNGSRLAESSDVPGARVSPSPIRTRLAATILASELKAPQSPTPEPSVPGRTTARVLPRILGALHAAASISYAVGISGFSVYRLVTREARRGFYHQLAVASRHHHHSWTSWELFDLGGLDDTLSVPTAMALGYLLFAGLSILPGREGEALRASPRAKAVAHAISALLVAGYCEITYTVKPSGVDVMNLLSYGGGGIAAALLGFLFWWPRSPATERVRPRVSMDLIYKTLAISMAATFPFAMLFDFVFYGYGLAVNFSILAAFFAIPIALLFSYLQPEKYSTPRPPQ